MKSLNELTKEERSLLIFLETQAVDYGGGVDVRHMNSDDMKIAEQWKKENFIEFGRIASKDLKVAGGHVKTHWVKFTDESFQLAAEERKARAARMWEKRTWHTTAELRG